MSRIFAAALFTLFVPTLVQAQNWIVYSPEGMSYHIDMPQKWVPSQQTIPTDVGPVEMYMATIGLGARAYMAIHSSYPQSHIDTVPPDTMLNNARDGAVSSVKGKLLKEDRFTISGYPARHLVVDTPQGRISQRMVLVGVTLVQAIYVGPAGDEAKADVQRFFSSLTIMNPGISPDSSPDTSPNIIPEGRTGDRSEKGGGSVVPLGEKPALTPKKDSKIGAPPTSGRPSSSDYDGLF